MLSACPLHCAVMTQEMCKDFLAGSSNRDASARQRYKLYMKATSLEQAEEGLARARFNVADTQERLQVLVCVVEGSIQALRTASNCESM